MTNPDSDVIRDLEASLRRQVRPHAVPASRYDDPKSPVTASTIAARIEELKNVLNGLLQQSAVIATELGGPGPSLSAEKEATERPAATSIFTAQANELDDVLRLAHNVRAQLERMQAVLR